MANAVMHTTGQAFADGLPGRRPACAGPRARGGGDGLGRDDPQRPPPRSGRSRRARPRRSCWRSTGAWCRAASRWSSAARPSRPGTAIPASSPASPPATPVIVKPHPGAILPLALTVAVLREVLAEQGLPRDVVLLAADAAGRRGHARTSCAIRRSRSSTTPARTPSAPGCARTPARRRSTPRRRASTRSSSPRPTTSPACAPTSPSRSRSTRGQMCTAPQDIFVPRGGIDDRRGPQVLRRGGRRHRRRGRCAARRSRPAPPASAAPSPTRRRSSASPRRASLGRIVRDSAPLAEGRSATPLIVAVDAADDAAYGEERFGPIAFVVAVERCRRRHRPRRRSRAAQGRDHRGALRHRRGAHPARRRRLRARRG